MHQVGVPRQPVQQILHGADIVVCFHIRLPLRNDHGALGHGLPAKAAGLVEKCGGIIGADRVAGLIPHIHPRLDHRALAFAPIVHVGDHILILKRSLDRIDGAVHDDLMIHVQKRNGGLDQFVGDHGGGQRHPLIRLYIHRAPVGDRPVGGQRFQNLFIGVLQILRLGTHRQRVQCDVPPVVLHIAGFRPQSYQLCQIDLFHGQAPFSYCFTSETGAPTRSWCARLSQAQRCLALYSFSAASFL